MSRDESQQEITPHLDATPDAWLDQFRAHPEWGERTRDEMLGRMVERFAIDALMEAVQARLHDLRGGDAEVMLRLIEANPVPHVVQALAEAIDSQPNLPPDRAWEALAVLDAAGHLDVHPALAERWEELNELIAEDGSVEPLLDQIENDPDGVWLALQGLGAVEPEVRPAILAGLVGDRETPGPRLVEFFRLLAYAGDPATRGAAWNTLQAVSGPMAEAAWLDLAEHHPDPLLASAARQQLRGSGAGAGLPARGNPSLSRTAPVRSLVSAIDGLGRASIILSASRDGQHATATFLCNIETGVSEAFGDLAQGPSTREERFQEFVSQMGPVASIEGAHALALGLLAGCLTLIGPATSPALQFWVEATAGPGLRPHPFRAEFPGWDPAELSFKEMPERVADVLDACPDWLDASPLTYELAEEVMLREGDVLPDPLRDAGAYRFLFEHRLLGQLERFRRMLLWMAWFWRASGNENRARSALALAWQLSDAQHVVPAHPFTVALTTRSLTAAMADLKQGVDPRRSRRAGPPC